MNVRYEHTYSNGDIIPIINLNQIKSRVYIITNNIYIRLRFDIGKNLQNETIREKPSTFVSKVQYLQREGSRINIKNH